MSKKITYLIKNQKVIKNSRYKSFTIFIGASGGIIEALERGYKVIQICEIPIFEAYSNKIWKSIKGNMSAFAGEDLELNMPVYISEANDNLRNQAIAHLLKAYGIMYFDPVQATDVYTKQCALNVNVMNLATMAGTFSNGGLNPVTKNKVVSPTATQQTLAVMSTAGLYDDAGIWLYYTGVPAKSGVGGGLIAVVPGQFGIAVIAPPLDPAGNSVKGQLAIQYIIDELGVNPYLIEPKK